MIIHNSECQKGQLEIELQEKDTIYKKLLEKIARNENEQKKIGSNSEHYLKTIELLEKSRAEQLELKYTIEYVGNKTKSSSVQW